MTRILAMAACLAGVPLATLAALVVGGWLAAVPALLAVAVIVLAMLAFVIVWVRDVDVLIDAVRHVATDDPGASPPVAPGLALMEAVGREIERLMRRVATRTALVEQFRRADEAILERLPDPLIVLAPDRTVRHFGGAASPWAADGD
jgi:two-component system phosphate regulon sensor histidine kinase PhoR